MPIQVTCPKCFKRFQVSEKFAGKTGPCPNCKSQIKVPEASEEVVIHAPEDDAPKDRSGQSVLKPLKREETDFTRRGVFLTVASVVLAVGAAITCRFLFPDDTPPVWILIGGSLLLGPPLISAGYSFVRDSELAPYVGAELRNRVLILSAILAALWLVYAFVPTYVLELDAASEMSYLTFGIVFSVMVVMGAAASSIIFELEFTEGLAHAGLYLIVTLVLAVLSGLNLATG